MPEHRRALITRPREDSAALAEAVKRLGIEPVSAPMMAITYVSADIEDAFDSCQAVLFTSRNGVRALCRLTQRRDKKAYAVGDGTADLARENGFASVRSASGDSQNLARLVVDTLKPEDGPLLHAAGATVAGDLSGALEEAGFRTIRRTMYSAEPVGELPPGVLAALRDSELDCVLLFSPRTARIFLGLVAAAEIGSSLSGLAAVCMSDAVANELDPAAWREIRVAAAPTSETMVKMLETDFPARPAVPKGTGVSRRAMLWRRAVTAVAVVVAAGSIAFVSWRSSERDARDSARIESQIRENVAMAAKDNEKRTAGLARRVEQAEARLAEAAGRLDKLTARLASATDHADGEAATRTALAEKIAHLEKAVAELQSSLAAAQAAELRRKDELDHLSSSFRDLTMRIGKLEGRLKVRQSAGGALALAAGQLRNAVARSAPHAAELAILEGLAAQDRRIAAALVPLAADAESGVPSRAVLFARLPAAVAAAAAANQPEAEGGWVDRMSNWLRSLVRVRRIDGKGDGVDALLARAELAAGRGDLAAAVQELSGLRGESAQAAAPWLAAARSRIETENALAELDRIVLGDLSR